LTLLLIVVGIAVVLALAVLLIYNRMISRRNAVDNSWAQIEAALQRRHDLIPNLIESVKGYAKHERQTFEEVTKAKPCLTRFTRSVDIPAVRSPL
jgi:LemA protein